MINRVRDRIRNIRVQKQIPFAEWQAIEERFTYAMNFFREDNHLYMIMKADLKNAEDIVLENRIHEVHEVRVVTDFLKKIFVTPREQQLNELIGQIKYIRAYFAQLESWITEKQDLERAEAAGKAIIERGK